MRKGRAQVWLTSAAHQECRDSFLLSPLFANHSLHPFPKSPGPPPSDDEGAMSEGEEDGEAAMQQYSPDEDEAVHTFLGHGREVYAAAWHPSAGDLVATGGADDRAFLWRVGQDAYEETQGEVKELSGHTDTVASLAFSHDGTLLATGGMDGELVGAAVEKGTVGRAACKGRCMSSRSCLLPHL